jgi:hypothetical protein
MLVCAVGALCAALGWVGRAWAQSGAELAHPAAATSVGEWLLCGVSCLPLLLYVHIAEGLGVLVTRRHLAGLARVRPEFDWTRLAGEAIDAIGAIYAACEAGDLALAAAKMSPEYYAARRALLGRWHAEGKRNVRRLERVRSLRPLWVATRDATRQDTLALLVRVGHLDYLEELATRRLIKGKRKPDKRFEAVWLFSFIAGAWRVSGVEGHHQAYGFATLANRVSVDAAFGPRGVSRPLVAPSIESAALQHQESRVAQTANAEPR